MYSAKIRWKDEKRICTNHLYKPINQNLSISVPGHHVDRVVRGQGQNRVIVYFHGLPMDLEILGSLSTYGHSVLSVDLELRVHKVHAKAAKANTGS